MLRNRTWKLLFIEITLQIVYQVYIVVFQLVSTRSKMIKTAGFFFILHAFTYFALIKYYNNLSMHDYFAKEFLKINFILHKT